MRANKKYFSIIITSNFSEKVKSYKLSLFKAKFILFIVIILCCAVIGLIFIYGSISYKNLKIIALSKENKELKNKVEKILVYEKDFDKLNKNVLKIANMLGVSKIADNPDISVKFNPQKISSKLDTTPLSLYPVKGYITQRFDSTHQGIDISANYGDSVITTIDGTVESVEYDSILGNVVKIYNKEFKIIYGHLAKIKVKKGEKVSHGDLIGFVGSTGKSAGPHLHYEIWEKGNPQNPEDYLRR